MATSASASPSPALEVPEFRAPLAGLRVGSQGPDVRSLQQSLLDAGVTVRGGADGVYGPATRQAVIDFQRSNGLPATGEVDAATSAALLDNDSGALATLRVGLTMGTRGPQVTALQEQLMAGGVYLPGGADGVFGTATDRAVTQFQRWNGLTPTGVVDAATASRLDAAGGGPAPRLASNPPATTNDSGYVGLARGSRGPLVKKLQEALQSTGLVLRGGADGVFGPATESALKAFQGVNSITRSGVVTERGARLLGLVGGSSGGGGATTNDDRGGQQDDPYVGLTVGASGPLVRELQSALQNTGLTVRGGADGSFGPATRSALVAFQSVNGIPQSGVVTKRGAEILGLGTGTVGLRNPNTNDGASIRMERFPVQGLCFFGDTWHAARGGGRLHVGVDIIADEGKLLYAVVDGEISKLYWDQPGALAGNGLRIAQPDGTYFTYLHMLGFAPGIELGTKVKAGDVIGFVGNTGSSATAHLHFEIHPNGGAAINPYPFMKAMDECANTTPRYQSSFS